MSKKFSDFALKNQQEPHFFLVGYDADMEEEIRIPVTAISGNSIAQPTGLTGDQNAVNRTFNTLNDFVANTTALYLNGVRQYRNYDYVESGYNRIIFLHYSPVGEDRLYLEALLKN